MIETRFDKLRLNDHTVTTQHGRELKQHFTIVVPSQMETTD